MARTDILFFAGIKHSGKTTMARLCAKRLGIPHYDSDDILLETIKADYPDIRNFYRDAGPEQFKNREAKALRDFIGNLSCDDVPSDTGVDSSAVPTSSSSANPPTPESTPESTATPFLANVHAKDADERRMPRMIIALGGGACDNDELMDIVHQNGTSCYLAHDPQVLLRRILRHGVPPFLDTADIEGSFAKLYVRRDGLYRSGCDFVIQLPDCENPEETCSFLLESLEKAMEAID